ncbi:hypothetical protein RF11_11496 [Thelohanellus kitauei]|uniref:Uncharacterized protein n=1 Tax=Thelohanellus kitauei TaxID=669202 RepID=A0A0C2J4T5_THEKT|nr:hypothetical protein RF11_11496 [Thelohanellus kitauei]
MELNFELERQLLHELSMAYDNEESANIKITIETTSLVLPFALDFPTTRSGASPSKGVLYITLNDFFKDDLLFVEKCSIQLELITENNEETKKTPYNFDLELHPNTEKEFDLPEDGEYVSLTVTSR